VISVGTRILLSRRDPVRDVVLVNGTTVDRGVGGEQVSGQVYSATKSYIKVAFSEAIEDLEEGQWR
jgi:hypothetical protein